MMTHFDKVVFRIRDLANRHRSTWRTKDDAYWYMRLGEEFGELGASLAGDHPHAPEWELQQIAAICLNWLDKRGLSRGLSDDIATDA